MEELQELEVCSREVRERRVVTLWGLVSLALVPLPRCTGGRYLGLKGLQIGVWVANLKSVL